MKEIFSRRFVVGALTVAVTGVVSCMPWLAMGPVMAQETSKKIGISIPTLNNPFWVRAVEFAEQVGKVLDIEITVVGAENREDKQLTDVQSLIAGGSDALVVTPQSTASAGGLIRLASRANIPIMLVDRYPDFPANNPDAPYLGFVGPNDDAAGRAMVKALADRGARKLVGIGGTPGNSVTEGRKMGYEAQIAELDGVENIQFFATTGESEDLGYVAMQNLLAAHPSGTFDGVWCFNDALCLGAFRAIKQAGRDHEIILASMDLMAQALELIENQTNLIYSTGGHWLQLGFGVMIAYDKLNGHDPLNTDIRMDLLSVDGENFDRFKSQFIDGPPPYDIKDYTLTHNPQTKSQIFPLEVK